MLMGFKEKNKQTFLYIQTLHYDCSHIEDVHLLFCAHLIIILGVLNFYTTFGVLTLCFSNFPTKADVVGNSKEPQKYN